MILWLKATIAGLFGANEAPSVELLEIDIVKELDFNEEGLTVEELESTEISNFKWEL
jgi:hypothetical protein